jgi:hypothetical protein
MLLISLQPTYLSFYLSWYRNLEDIFLPRESGRAMRAAVFYEPEYRELCLQQLSSFNPDRMSIGKYLTELFGSDPVSRIQIFLILE